MTKIKKCTCTNEYQDKKYGQFNRVHNQSGTKEKVTWTCTVCGKKSD